MTEAGRLGGQIEVVVAVRREGVRDPLFDDDAAARQRRLLVRVVGKQAYPGEAESVQHAGGRQVDALVGVEAELSLASAVSAPRSWNW